MVIIKYKKMGVGAFIDNTEMLSCWGRVFNRANIIFDKDNGEEFYILQPSPLKIESEIEYLCIIADKSAEQIEDGVARLFPDWIEIIGSCKIDENIDLQEQEYYQEFMFSFPEIRRNIISVTKAFSELLKTNKITALKVTPEGVIVTQSSILSNTMCDIAAQIVAKCNMENDYSLVRKKLLISIEGKLTDFEEFLNEKTNVTSY